MKQQFLGILTARNKKSFFENMYFRHLIRAGRRLGVTVYLFSDEDVDLQKKRIYGTTTGPDGGWQTSWYAWPDIVIERRRSRWTPGYRTLRSNNSFTYANSPFTLKANYTRLFAAAKEVQKWIPDTIHYSPHNLMTMLRKFPSVYVKPDNGTAGHSVVRIKQADAIFTIFGRQRNAALQNVQLHNIRKTVNWINRWVRDESIRSGGFMIQQGLELELIPGRMVDSRILIQKSSAGKWNVTGMAVRVGGEESPTTNLLYGDGKAYPFRMFMVKQFGIQKAGLIEQECRKLAHAVVQTAERHFGSMMEFGLDVGVDKNGKVWLIEANPKPSRDVFLKCGQPGIYWNAVRNPIHYAKFLMNKANTPQESPIKTKPQGTTQVTPIKTMPQENTQQKPLPDTKLQRTPQNQPHDKKAQMTLQKQPLDTKLQKTPEKSPLDTKAQRTLQKQPLDTKLQRTQHEPPLDTKPQLPVESTQASQMRKPESKPRRKRDVPQSGMMNQS